MREYFIGRAGALARRIAFEDNRKRAFVIPTTNIHEVFNLIPAGDPANDDEALQERVAILMEGNGWNEATALREASRDADRERRWQPFLLNAKRVLDAPAAHQEALLARYRVEAVRRYGQAAGANMACGLRAWVTARAVHSDRVYVLRICRWVRASLISTFV